jgi:hypothetical protein
MSISIPAHKPRWKAVLPKNRIVPIAQRLVTDTFCPILSSLLDDPLENMEDTEEEEEERVVVEEEDLVKVAGFEMLQPDWQERCCRFLTVGDDEKFLLSLFVLFVVFLLEDLELGGNAEYVV